MGRNQLMSSKILVVDDEPDLEDLIVQHFAGIPRPDTPLDRPTFDVPDNEQILFAIATDKEATGSKCWRTGRNSSSSIPRRSTLSGGW